jgi:Putative peptidoglycan binding domain
MPRRRRGARAIAVEAETERGFAMRVLLHSPKDTVAGALAFAAAMAIIVNALFLQTGHHPSPMFGSVVVMPAPPLAMGNPLPRPRPMEADASPIELKLAEPKIVEPKIAEPKPIEPKPIESKGIELKTAEPKPVDPKLADPLANLVKATSATVPSNIVRPPASIPVSSRSDTSATSAPASRRVAAVQRALTEFGYAQLKPTGTVGSDTQAAIQKFERERKLPVTGQVSDRLVRELAAMIGHPVD